MTIAASLTLLEINTTPTKASVKKAFRAAALKYHPDTRGTHAKFIEIKTAYDTLMALSAEELSRSLPTKMSPRTSGPYDPFNDARYSERRFFQPDNVATEGFERKIRAKNCPHCGGYGFITKNIDPAKGFMGRERRLCKCQWT